jgi:competence protein ComFC
MLRTGIWRPIGSLLWPVECVSCHVEGEWLCTDCQNNLELSRTDLCSFCGKAGQNGICDSCQKSLKLDGVVSLFPYNQLAIQEIIRQAKYRGHTDALYYLTSQFLEDIDDRLPSGGWKLVPIPLAKERMRERGFNQSLVLAKIISSRQLPIWLGLKRHIDTPAQAKLDKKDRRLNIKDCFSLIAPAPEKVILVDDVTTTGSTLAEAAKLLRHHGTKEVWAITLAHG